MPDDDRTRRRLGDATKGRIADLADGWNVPASEDSPAAPEPSRPRKRTVPPPPPGSAERKALEEAIVDAKDSSPTLTPVADPPPERRQPTMPPPLPPRAKAATSDLPVVRFKTPSQPPPPPPASRPKSPTSQPPTVPEGTPRPATPPSQPPVSGSVRVPSPTQPPVSGSVRVPSPTQPPPASKPISQPPATLPPIPSPLVIVGSTPIDATVVDKSPPPVPPPPLTPTLPTPQAESFETATDIVNSLHAVPVPEVEPEPSVPLGEFGDGIDDGKRRALQAQLTMKRDAAEALLKMPPPAPPPKPKPIVVASPVVEERGDPTAVDPSFAQNEASASRRGKLRAAAKLRRKRGLLGDVKYVFTALFGVRRSRRELSDLEIRQDTRRQSRKRHLITLGRTAALAAFEHPALSAASEALVAAEDERSQHAGGVAAADAEADRVRRDRETAAKTAYAEKVALDAELADLAKKLEPLEREAAVVQKRADALRDALARIDRQIAATEASTTSLKNPKTDLAGVKAEVAALRADRKAVERDEPVIAAELDTLNPRIASIKAKRSAATERKYKIGVEEEEDKRRADDLLAAIATKRKVVDRAQSDAEGARDKILLELGERLYLDRPHRLAAQLTAIDEIDLELGTSERRLEELREILSNVDRAKVARGAAVIVLLIAVLGFSAVAILRPSLIF